MADRNSNRDRRGDPQNDWQWDYYYEYRYMPDYPGRRSDFHDRDFSDRDYYDNNMYYGRNYDYNRNDFGTESRDSRYRRSTAGPFSGYGPRGYKRSDERILEDINDRLTWHSLIDATGITAAVKDGIVTLTGSVDARSDKRLAEDIVDDIPGVHDVDNRLQVRSQRTNRGWESTANRGEIRPGMEVVSGQGERVGQVKEVREKDFLVDRPAARDVYVPFSACDVSGGQVILNVEARDVDNQDWMMPQPVESQRSQKNR